MFSSKKRLDSNKMLTADEILSKMEHFCAYRERCPQEVRNKLKTLGATSAVARQVFEVLQTDKFFDETRFALAFAGGKFRNNHWGKVRIGLELRMRDIAPETIQHALDSIDVETYDALLVKLLQKKMGQYEGADNPTEKAAASLIRAGFESDLVFKKIQLFRAGNWTSET